MTNALTTTYSFEPVIGLVLDSVTSEHSRRAYERGLTDFCDWYADQGAPGLRKATVNRYKRELTDRGLAPATVNQRLTAVRKLAVEAADNGLMDPHLAGGIARVQGVKSGGVRTGNWLTQAQAQALINAPDLATLKGKRDRAILAVLLGAGLRREECAALELAQVQQRDARWVLVDLLGKGRKVRSVPIPSWTKAAIDCWTEAAGITDGRLFRPVNKGDRMRGAAITGGAIAAIVRDYGERLGFDGLAAHDLRRTYAKLAHKGGAALDQIQLSLGHASLQTTQKYLGICQDLTDAPCDVLGLRLE